MWISTFSLKFTYTFGVGYVDRLSNPTSHLSSPVLLEITDVHRRAAVTLGLSYFVWTRKAAQCENSEPCFFREASLGQRPDSYALQTNTTLIGPP